MENQKPKIQFKIVWSFIMVLIYVAIAIILAFTPIFEDKPLIMRIAMSTLLFLYGLFRGYRLWKIL